MSDLEIMGACGLGPPIIWAGGPRGRSDCQVSREGGQRGGKVAGGSETQVSITWVRCRGVGVSVSVRVCVSRGTSY